MQGYWARRIEQGINSGGIQSSEHGVAGDTALYSLNPLPGNLHTKVNQPMEKRA